MDLVDRFFSHPWHYDQVRGIDRDREQEQVQEKQLGNHLYSISFMLSILNINFYVDYTQHKLFYVDYTQHKA